MAAALERVHDDLVAGLPEAGSLRGDLLAMAEGIASLLRKPLGRELARAAFAEDAESELATLAASRLGGRAAGPVLQMVRRARERGELRDDVDARSCSTSSLAASSTA